MGKIWENYDTPWDFEVSCFKKTNPDLAKKPPTQRSRAVHVDLAEYPRCQLEIWVILVQTLGITGFGMLDQTILAQKDLDSDRLWSNSSLKVVPRHQSSFLQHSQKIHIPHHLLRMKTTKILESQWSQLPLTATNCWVPLRRPAEHEEHELS